MQVIQFLLPFALFLPFFVGVKWRQRLQNRMATRYSRGQQFFIGFLGYLGMIAFAVALGLFGFYQHVGFQVPIFMFLMSSANCLFGSILFGAFRSAPKKRID